MAEILYVKWSVAQTKRTISNSGVKCQMVLGPILTKIEVPATFELETFGSVDRSYNYFAMYRFGYISA